MPTSITTDARVARVIAAFESLQPGDVAGLGALYTENARFKDPFNEVQGHAALRRVFEHMFVALDEPRFVVTEAIVQGDRCFLVWDFLFRFKRWTREPQAVRGGSHVVFAPDGRIALHRDYWDAAEELYEKLPGIGAAMRWLKRRANA
jgi:ketosteroid isomerase-like protein